MATLENQKKFVHSKKHTANLFKDQSFNTMKKRVIALLVKTGCHREDAEDIFCQGLLILLLNLRNGMFREASTLETYIFGICRKLWLKKIRSDKVRSEYKDRMIPKSSYSPNNFGEQDHNPMYFNQLLRHLLQNLKNNCAEVLSMWASNYSMKEIAERLNYANAQVAMNKKHRCMNELCSILSNSPRLTEELKNQLHK